MRISDWSSDVCSSDLYEEAHIEVDECGAPTFYLGGAKLMTVPGTGAKIDAAALKARIAGLRNDVHQVQPAAISIPKATEYVLAWRAGENGASSESGRHSGLQPHRDDAPFAHAAALP